MLVAATAAFLAAIPAAAWAADAQGLYLGGGGGLVFQRDSSVNIPGAGTQGLDWKTGFAGIASIGYAFPGGLRTELEAGYRQALSKVRVPSGRTIDNRLRSGSLMANAYYDFDTDSAITPYIGGGIGVALNNMGKTDAQFAYQGIAGASFALDERVDLFVDYRYFGTPKVAYRGATETTNQSHTVLAGLRYSFGNEVAQAAPEPPQRPRGPNPVYVPPPAEPPAAPEATAMAKSYLVFFDFDQSSLTPEGQRIVRTAAMNARDAAVTRVDVTGHTDRAGSNSYNAQLSKRRAQMVKRELVANGVRERDIVIYAKGETQPLVPTPDGVRDQQNRRVEIVLN